MAPLALIMLQRGLDVSGSDLVKNLKTDYLESSGAKIFAGHNANNLPDNPESLLVVYSSAVKSDNPEMRKALELGIPSIRRGEMLARLAETYQRPVAISGSHGKTTVSAMLVHILLENGVECGYMVGGKINGRETSSAAGNGDIFVTEVDESDGTNALVSPYAGLVTNVEDDHAWSVGGREKLFNNFSIFAGQSENLIYFNNDIQNKLFAGHPRATILSSEKISDKLLPPEWGRYQKLNAELAVQAAVMLGVDSDNAYRAVSNFPGVARRMVTHYSSDHITIIEDYAHHPTEIQAALETVRNLYPHHHLRVVFQPHRYARLERYINEFAVELGKADSILITPVFAAWTESGTVDSSDLAKLTGSTAIAMPLPWTDIAVESVKNETGKPLLLVILGAGDIEELIPLVTKQCVE